MIELRNTLLKIYPIDDQLVRSAIQSIFKSSRWKPSFSLFLYLLKHRVWWKIFISIVLVLTNMQLYQFYKIYFILTSTLFFNLYIIAKLLFIKFQFHNYISLNFYFSTNKIVWIIDRKRSYAQSHRLQLLKSTFLFWTKPRTMSEFVFFGPTRTWTLNLKATEAQRSHVICHNKLSRTPVPTSLGKHKHPHKMHPHYFIFCFGNHLATKIRLLP